jgi:hypothetical protein
MVFQGQRRGSGVASVPGLREWGGRRKTDLRRRNSFQCLLNSRKSTGGPPEPVGNNLWLYWASYVASMCHLWNSKTKSSTFLNASNTIDGLAF